MRRAEFLAILKATLFYKTNEITKRFFTMGKRFYGFIFQSITCFAER
jgi:hypothetical protein